MNAPKPPAPAPNPALQPERLGYRVDELAPLLGVSVRTIKRRVADGTLKSTKALGVRLISAESVRALFAKATEPALTRKSRG
jgi:excisionase family DNA binding protein